METKLTKTGRVDRRFKERAKHHYVSCRVTAAILEQIHQAVIDGGWASVSDWMRGKIYGFLADEPKRKEMREKTKKNLETMKKNPFF